eukprot:m.73283 g.73283  ORF g.73283 m.73283 type:complete len:475 (+) comp24542_c0_seq1:198-1622(+)
MSQKYSKVPGLEPTPMNHRRMTASPRIQISDPIDEDAEANVGTGSSSFSRFRRHASSWSTKSTRPTGTSTALTKNDIMLDVPSQHPRLRRVSFKDMRRRKSTHSKPITSIVETQTHQGASVVEYDKTDLITHWLNTEEQLAAFESLLRDRAKDSGKVYWIRFMSTSQFGFQRVVECLDAECDYLRQPSLKEGRALCRDFTDHTVVSTSYFSVVVEDEDDQGSVNKSHFLSVLTSNVLVTVVDEAIAKIGLQKVQLTKKFREKGDASLLFAYLINTATEKNFQAVQFLGDCLADMESEILSSVPNQNIARLERSGLMGDVHVIKRELFVFRQALWPLREVFSALSSPVALIMSEEAKDLLRRTHDQCIQLLDIVETYRELGTSLIELYTSQVSFLLEKQMKIMAMMDFIFLPMTFMTGVYGMNFEYNMIEIHYEYGYPLFWFFCVMFLMVSFVFFHVNAWITLPMVPLSWRRSGK